MIAIIDYSIGNVQSLYNALSFHNEEIIITSDEKKILEADRAVLPGVGAYGKAMNELNSRNLPEILKLYIDSGKPLLGICLGMQLLLQESEEFGLTKGLGFVEGKVIKFPPSTEGKLPHVSWNELASSKKNRTSGILNQIDTDQSFYFVHSFICELNNSDDLLATTNYGGYEFCSVLKHKNIYGCQFHPEKSSHIGLQLLGNFLTL